MRVLSPGAYQLTDAKSKQAGYRVVGSLKSTGLAIGLGLWETVEIKKPSLRIIKFNGLVPVGGRCTACEGISFHLTLPDRVTDPQVGANALQEQFQLHFDHVHLREDASQAAARIGREATEN